MLTYRVKTLLRVFGQESLNLGESVFNVFEKGLSATVGYQLAPKFSIKYFLKQTRLMIDDEESNKNREKYKK